MPSLAALQPPAPPNAANGCAAKRSAPVLGWKAYIALFYAKICSFFSWRWTKNKAVKWASGVTNQLTG